MNPFFSSEQLHVGAAADRGCDRGVRDGHRQGRHPRRHPLQHAKDIRELHSGENADRLAQFIMLNSR